MRSRLLKIVLLITYILTVRCSGFITRSWFPNTPSKSLFKLNGGGINRKENKEIQPIIDQHYDIVVIGGGSGGIACAREASKLGKSVAVIDYVKPSVNQGTTWGLGGTCVNVGCIPKKLFHEASNIGHIIKNAAFTYGWEPKPTSSSSSSSSNREDVVSWHHNWSKLVSVVQDHIKSLNFKYENILKDDNIDYYNNLAQFTKDKKILKLKSMLKDQNDKYVTSDHFVIAVGGRPKILNITGGEHVITSDDLFSKTSLIDNLNNKPRILVIGGSYVGLECAGFLTGLGAEVVVMHRSEVLPGFDRTCAQLVASHMQETGTHFMARTQPVSIRKIKHGNQEGKFHVKWEEKDTSSDKSSGDDTSLCEGFFDLVISAVGREADVSSLGLDLVGVTQHKETHQIITNSQSETNVQHIYAIGDVVQGAPQLTPVATNKGEKLAQLLATTSSTSTSSSQDINDMVPTTVFTPLEYSTCGESEESALLKYGVENIDIYHNSFKPLENAPLFLLSQSMHGYCKAIVLRNGLKHQNTNQNMNDLVIGLHYVGPHAGEVMQGFSIALKMKMSLYDLKSSIGIHPTCAENMLKLKYKSINQDDTNQDGAKSLLVEVPPVGDC